MKERIRRSLDPYIASLSRRAAWFSRYYAITYPPFPNHLAIVAGISLFGIAITDRLS